MYAVIETGGKQYRVEVGTELQVELLDVEPGKTIILERVLLIADGDEAAIGRPLVADAAVSAEVVRQMRGEKVISFKYRPKARSRVKKGHRQELTVLRISDITFGGRSAAKDAAKAERDAKSERQHLEEAAAVQAAKDAELAAKLAVGADVAPKKTTPKKTVAKAGAKADTAKSDAKADAKADAKPSVKKADAAAKSDPAKADPPRTTKAKATKAEADDAKPAAPKRTRATKKDE